MDTARQSRNQNGRNGKTGLREFHEIEERNLTTDGHGETRIRKQRRLPFLCHLCVLLFKVSAYPILTTNHTNHTKPRACEG